MATSRDLSGLIDTTGKGLWQLIVERADATPDKRMGIDEAGRTLTYGEYRAWCERVAAGLADLGISEDSNVSWILPVALRGAGADGRVVTPGRDPEPDPADLPAP